MTEQLKPVASIKVIATSLQHWLFFHESDYRGGELHDDLHVIPPAWPSRGVLANWIKAINETIETVLQLQREIAKLKEQCTEFREAYRRLFSKRAARVVDLKIKVWDALNRKACPAGFMHVATEAIMEFGCGEIADLKKRLEDTCAELAAANTECTRLRAACDAKDAEIQRIAAESVVELAAAKQQLVEAEEASTAELHSDDIAVDNFAACMKAKLAVKRTQGRGGWDDKSSCSAEVLSRLLFEHAIKGDPIDVANFAMMLHQRGEWIDAARTAQANSVEQDA